MSRQNSYYTLLASLPWLPRFEQADRLPLSEKRLRERLAMLQPEDERVVRRGEAFLEWRQHPTERTDSEMVERYQRMMEVIKHPALKTLVSFEIDQRTIMAALRRRYRGQAAPASNEADWGVGQWVRTIEKNWETPDFKLGKIHPWIPQAKTYLEQGETMALERFLMNELWNHIDRTIPGNDFGFESVLAYLFKWRLLQQWLSYDTKAAKARFDDLVSEVMNEHQQLFN
ncbi:hypothetical protein CSA56_06310 [candidate division KSB3 bacterium]|uniref:DUF2764 domain-containing protein n=1 Tax=candidate division KSB3 bacterium TaxID=2044937 RepID=A0A2G6KGY6_9BACT|nr:MAG: hypothetical protein CSA56_06310 [candidate division KSB3 bacterium]